MQHPEPDLSPFFCPRSVVVYGATDDADKTGGRIFSLLGRSGLPVYPIHPSLTRIQQSPVYRTALDLPEQPDLAVLAVAARHCEQAVRDALAGGARGVIVVASGFGETGPPGMELERRLTRLARDRGARLLGPNTLGVFVPHKRLDTIFVEHGDRSLLAGGSIAVISQSGSVGVEALGYASASGFGLRAFVGLGNKADLNELDMAAWFARDPGARVLGFYLEDLADGRQFLKQVVRIALEKPVVILKGGRTEAVAKAVASHTGSLAAASRLGEKPGGSLGSTGRGTTRIFAIFTRSAPRARPWKGEGSRVAVLTPARGSGVMAVDCLASQEGPARSKWLISPPKPRPGCAGSFSPSLPPEIPWT